MDPAHEKCCELLRKFEGFRAKAYPDPATGGDPWTIGFGATGPEISKGVVWTRAQAEADLSKRVTELLTKIRDSVRVGIPPAAVGVLASFAYNVGFAAFARSTLLRKLNSRDFAGAAAQFDFWTKAGGKVFPGLVKRRAQERAAFESAVFS